MKFFLKKIAIYLLIFFAISSTLYYFSKHNLLFDYTAKKFVQALSLSDQVIKDEFAEDRRICFQLIAKHKKQHFQHLFIGSSRIMQLGKYTGFQKSLNLGVSAANLNDIQSVIQLTHLNQIQFDTLVIDVNPWTVCTSIESRYHEFSTLYNIRTALKDIFTFNFEPNDLFDLFKTGQKKYFSANNNDIHNPNNFIRFSDGSIKQKTLGPFMKSGRVDFFCQDLYLLKNFYHIDTLLLNQFVDLLKSESKKHPVIVFLSPFHPKLFQTKNSDIRVRNLQKLESQLFAKTPKNIQIIGGFNPIKFNLTDSNFVDGFHINETTIAGFFRKSP